MLKRPHWCNGSSSRAKLSREAKRIAIIESDKADVELESITAGVVLELLFQPGDDVPIGAVIARVGSAEEDRQQLSPTAANTASPIAARIAQANTLDLAAIDGSGPRGRVMRQDVEQQLARRTHESIQLGALPKVRRALRQAGLTLEQVYDQTRRNPIQMRDVQSFLAQQTPSATAPAVDAVPKPADALPADAREVPITRMRQAIGRQLAQEYAPGTPFLCQR